MPTVSDKQRLFDIAIVGGGLVGASLACALSSTGLQVIVIEAVPFKSDSQPSYTERMLALSYSTKNILAATGVWPDVMKRDATPIKSIHISDRGHSGFTRLSHTDVDVEALGYIVPARVLGQALIFYLENTDVEIVCPGRVRGISYDQDCAILEVDSDGTQTAIRSRLIVVADGGRSSAREWLGIRAVTRDYGQTAILTTVTPHRDHENKAYERFTATGPLALLPTSNNRYAVVWTVKTAQTSILLNLADQEFLDNLQCRFGDRAGEFVKLGQRKAYPLSLVRVPNPVAHRAVFIGNAAHTLHPVAGQGFNLGLRDVAVLAEVLNKASQRSDDIGSISVLNGYVDWRRRDTRATVAFTDGLVRLFSNESTPLALLRGASMVAVDIFPPLKRTLLRHTMGLGGKVPKMGLGLPLE